MKQQTITLERWTRPDNYCGENFTEYYRTGIGQSRDSHCLERANFIAMLEKLGGESETVIVARFGHWAVGWVEAIYIHESDVKSLQLASEIMSKFSDYPVIDEHTLLEVEVDEIESLVESFKNDFTAEICQLLGVEFDDLSTEEQDQVVEFIYYVLNEDSAYRGIEDAFVDEASIERAIRSLKYVGFDNELTKYLRTAFDVDAA